MSSVVLSSSVRQNLLSLQSTADLLSTTQSRLSTGKKVNSAIDNPTNYFTAQSLDNRSSDINNLLDGISNGVQVLNAANTGITSLQKLVDSAKSVANQALQATVGYTTKSTLTSSAVAGATASNILGTAVGGTSGTVTAGTFSSINVGGAGTAATAGTNSGGSFSAAIDVSSTALSFSVAANGGSPTTVTINAAAVTAYNTANSTSLSASALSGTDVSNLVNAQLTSAGVGASAALTGGKIVFTSSTTGASSNVTIGSVTGASTSGITAGAGTSGTAAVLPSESFNVTIDGSAHAVTLSAATVSAYNSAKGASASASALTASDVAGIANYQIGSNVASVVSGALTFTSTTTGSTSSVVTSSVTTAGGATGSTGITATSNTGTAGITPLGGLTLNIASTGGGTATAITFGTGTGQISTLNDLNTALSSNNLQASIDSTGVLSITTTNDAASSTIGLVTGTATGTGKAFASYANATGSTPVKDPAAQLTRSNLVTQYNNILDQITSTAQDASYNGTNLLNGDNLKLTFNETGKSTLNVTGTTLNATGLGLSKLTEGTDFTDNSSANTAISSLSNASSTLRTQASSLGSNLSVVQIRQDFSKNLINVLTTGSSNLTLADTNEEAANSQALSTRQSIAVSALSLANTSQQSVLTLLR